MSYDTHNPDKKAKELEVNAITLYSSEYSYQPGNLIAVNRNYICYAVRGDMIRVLHKKSGNRGLLKGHSGGIADIQFSSAEDSDILVSGGKDGNIFVWKLIENSAQQSINSETVLHVKTSAPYVVRLAWNPKEHTVFASGESDGSVTIWDLKKLEGVTESDYHKSSMKLSTGTKQVSVAMSLPLLYRTDQRPQLLHGGTSGCGNGQPADMEQWATLSWKELVCP